LSSNPPAWPAGLERRVLDEVDSTNAEAARLAATPGGPVWILGLRQTMGRGRRGRAWNDPSGNFAATLLMRPAPPPQLAALRSFVAALALSDALQAAAGVGPRLSLKWPNDVLLDGGKLAGILLEGGAGHLCVGIGVNLVHAPAATALEPGALPPVSLLGATGVALTPGALLDHVAPAFDDWDTRLDRYGFAPIRNAFLTRAARLGQTITARTGPLARTGVFETISPEGALVLRMFDGLVEVTAADVFFGDERTGEADHASGN
jgi:BirA family biotin operon repressor/biotin-[acetyl-CoA-carboxylase] ligase